MISVKPGDPSAINGRFNLEPGGRFTAENVTLSTLLETAFNFSPTRIEGMPAWAKTARFTIEATPAAGLPSLRGQANGNRLDAMLQTLLAERCRLVTYRGARRMAVYELVIARGGSKFPPSPPPGQPAAIVGPRDPAHPNLIVPAAAGQSSAAISGIEHLPDFLERTLDRPVIDKTGIHGNYEIRLTWLPGPGERVRGGAPPPDASGPSIFTALQEQLGLEVRPARDDVPVLVIDHIERPSEN